MSSGLTANALSGRATGSLFFTGFGALWLLLGLYVRESLSASSIALLVVILAALLLAAFRLFALAKRWPLVADDPAVGKAFGRINTIQWCAVFVVAFTLGRFGQAVFIVPAIAAIVGLHLFPLARVFHYPMHYVTGAALVVWAAGTAMLVPREHLQGLAALGTGAILWTSAAITLLLALVSMRRATIAAPATSVR